VEDRHPGHTACGDVVDPFGGEDAARQPWHRPTVGRGGGPTGAWGQIATLSS
jgi:hypothetical protein